MAHLIEETVDTIYTPQGNDWEKTWHGLQTPVQGGIAPDLSNVPLAFCPIRQCGFKPDFECEISKDVPEDLKSEGVDFSDWKLIIADCRKGKSGMVHPLHVPKKGYAIHDNRKLAECQVKSAEKVLGQGGFEIVSLGTVGAYTQFFMSIAIKGKEGFTVGTLPDGKTPDTFKQFLNCNTSHNSLTKSTRGLSAIRQVCFNTISMSVTSILQNGTGIVMKHTPSSVNFITPEIFAADFEAWLTQGEKFQAFLAHAKDTSIDVDKFRAFTAGVFTGEDSDKLSTTSFNRIDDMTALFNKGQGNAGQTLFDGINAFTEYFTHGRGLGNEKMVQRGKRVASANFGRGNDWKLEAIRVSETEKEFKATIKRGNRLLNDYLATESATAN